MRSEKAEQGFRPLLGAQFLGALNDNLFKLVASLVIVDVYAERSGLSSAAENIPGAAFALSLGHGLFVLPFILLGGYAGALSDRFSKGSILRAAKLFEVLVMLGALVALWTRSLPGLYATLFLMGFQSTLFSPAKYGSLPELLSDRRLPRGNGLLEFATFTAIIFGTALGGLLKGVSAEYASADSGLLYVGCALVLIAVGGLSFTFWIPRIFIQGEKRALQLNPFEEIVRAIKVIKLSSGLLLSLVASTWFWLLGSVFQLNVILYARTELQLGDTETALLLVLFGLGVGGGSALAGFLSRGQIRLDHSWFGAALMGVSMALLKFSSESLYLSAGVMLCLGLGGGFFIVPLNAYLQHHSPANIRARCIAAMNVVNYGGMLIAAVTLSILSDGFGLLPRDVFFVGGLLGVLFSALVYRWYFSLASARSSSISSPT